LIWSSRWVYSLHHSRSFCINDGSLAAIEEVAGRGEMGGKRSIVGLVMLTVALSGRYRSVTVAINGVGANTWGFLFTDVVCNLHAPSDNEFQ